MREYGRAEDDMPFPLECNLPILAQKSGAFGMVCRDVEKSKVVIFLRDFKGRRYCQCALAYLRAPSTK